MRNPLADGHTSQEIAAAAIALWDELAGGQVQPVKIRENAVFKVTGPRGGEYALRIHRPGYHSSLSLMSEYRWMAALRVEGLLTPKLLPSRSGRDFETVPFQDGQFQVDAFEWIESDLAPFPPGGGDASLDRILGQYHMMGQAMRRAHSHASTWKPSQPFERHAWDVNGLTGESPLWGRFWEYPALGDEGRRLMTSLREALRRNLSERSTDRGVYGLIHADIMPDNVIVACDGLYLIDFDDAGYGWYGYDQAVSLFSFQFHPAFESILEAFWTGYSGGPSLSVVERSDLDLFLAARGATLVGWLHTRDAGEPQSRSSWLIELATRAARRWLGREARGG